MSTVRFVDDRSDYGYGVDGFIQPLTGMQTSFGLQTYLADIPFRSMDDAGNPFVQAYVDLSWRLKIQTVNYGDFSQKIFNVKNERGIFGECRYNYRQYTSLNDFHSNVNYIGPLIYTTYLIDLPYNGETVLPCDEPPVDLNQTVQIRFAAELISGWINFGSNRPSDFDAGSKNGYPGDSVLYNPSYADLSYIAGITYFFKVNYLTQRRIDEGPAVVVGV